MPKKQSGPRPPTHLRAATKKWFKQVLEDYVLDAHHVRLLQLAAEAWDRGQEAREAITKHGLTFIDSRDNPRPRPEVNIERDSRLAFARLLRELQLDVEPPSNDERPPRMNPAATVKITREGA